VIEIERFLHTTLLNVRKPSRYIGGELNSIKKDPRGRLRFLLLFPDTYEVGMSHHGFRILYHLLNDQDWIYAERGFLPWVDMVAEMKEAGIPFFSLETKTPACAFDIVGISLQYELSYTSVLLALDLANIPLLSQERADDDPMVIAGGPCATNPEPVAPFFDAFVLGDGEEVALEVAHVVLETKGMSRKRRLEKLAGIEGVYVPALCSLERTGRFVVPKRVKVKMRRITKPWYQPTKQIVPYMEIVHDRGIVEIMRGCTRGCRFCQAGMIYRPVRELSREEIEKIARDLVEETGYEQVSLLSLSSMDHTDIEGILGSIHQLMKDRMVSLSIPSTRVDSFTAEAAQIIASIRKTGLTLAPEAGTQRLRDVINKNVTEEEILKAVESAAKMGWKRVKLYFMIGLPFEEDEDVEGIVKLVGKIRRMVKKVTVNVSAFIPKAHTPFQFVGFMDQETYKRRVEILSKLRGTAELKISDYHQSKVEALLSRGDRRLSRVVMAAFTRGAMLDEWEDRFDRKLWGKGVEEANCDESIYLDTVDRNEPLPWDFVDTGIDKRFLWNEYVKASKGEKTPDCRFGNCSGCGVCDFDTVFNRLSSKPVREEVKDV